MKDAKLVLLLLVIIFSLVFFTILCSFVFEWNRKRNLSKKSLNSNVIQGENKTEKLNNSNFAWFLRNGISFLKGPSKFLIQHSKVVNNFFTKMLLVCEENNIYCKIESLTSAYIFFVLLIAVFVALLFSSPFAGIAVVLCVCVCCATWLKSREEKKLVKIRSSIPDALRSMSSCFGAGYTIMQTFEHLVKESKGHIKKLFNKTCHVIQTGGSISQALDCLKNDNDAKELKFVAVALEVQHQTGGSIQPVLDSAKEMVDNKLELMRQLNVQTAQAKLSARIVMILPFVLITVFSIISPGFLLPFFSSFIGIIIFAVACLMQTSGVIMVKKMLNVEV